MAKIAWRKVKSGYNHSQSRSLQTMKTIHLLPSRVRILYVILGVLILVAVVPLWFYGTQVVSINRERLITNERLLQNTVTRSLAEDITQRQRNLQNSLNNLASAIQVASGNDLNGEHVST